MNEFTRWYAKHVETGWVASALLQAMGVSRQRTGWTGQGFGNPVGALPSAA